MVALKKVREKNVNPGDVTEERYLSLGSQSLLMKLKESILKAEKEVKRFSERRTTEAFTAASLIRVLRKLADGETLKRRTDGLDHTLVEVPRAFGCLQAALERVYIHQRKNSAFDFVFLRAIRPDTK